MISTGKWDFLILFLRWYNGSVTEFASCLSPRLRIRSYPQGWLCCEPWAASYLPSPPQSTQPVLYWHRGILAAVWWPQLDWRPELLPARRPLTLTNLRYLLFWADQPAEHLELALGEPMLLDQVLTTAIWLHDNWRAAGRSDWLGGRAVLLRNFGRAMLRGQLTAMRWEWRWWQLQRRSDPSLLAVAQRGQDG